MGKSVLASTTLLVDAPSIMSTSEIYDTSNSTRAAELDPLPPEVVGMKPFDRPEGIVLESVDDEDELSMTMTNCEAAVVERAEFTPLLNNVESQLDSDGNLRRRCGRCVGNARTRVSLSITTGKQRLGDLCIFNLDRNLFESCSDCRADRVCWINLQEIVFWLMNNIVIVSSAYY